MFTVVEPYQNKQLNVHYVYAFLYVLWPLGWDGIT